MDIEAQFWYVKTRRLLEGRYAVWSFGPRRLWFTEKVIDWRRA